MQIKLHGIFAEDFGPQFEIEASTIAEAIEGFTRQVGFYDDRPLEFRPIVKVAGIENSEDLYEKTELKEIHLVPAMIGGGGVGKILVGAALIAVAFIPGLGTIGSIALASVFFTAGATLVLSGAMQLFMKAPVISGAKQDAGPEASQYFGLADNTVVIGTPIAIQYGRGPASGHVLALNVDAKDIVSGTFPATTT